MFSIFYIIGGLVSLLYHNHIKLLV